MKAYPSYKEYKPSNVDWLGEIPEHWEVKKLKFLGTALIGLTYSPDDVVDENYLGKKYHVLRSSNIQNNKIELSDTVFVTKEIPQELKVQKDDILICARNGSRLLVGKSARINSALPNTTFGAFMTVFRSKINPFLSFYFNSTQFQSQTTIFLTTTINQLTNHDLNEVWVSVPPLSEQQMIADFLARETAKIDSLIQKRNDLIKLLQEKRSAVISHAVTKGIDPTVRLKPSNIDWLGEIPEHWEVRKLKYCFMLKTQKVTGARIPVALENIESWTGKYLPSESEFEGDGIAFESHDILFGKLRPYLAKVWAAEFAGEAIGDFFVLHPLKHMNSRFAAYYMRTSDFINLIDGSTFGSKMPRASWDFFSSTPINLPPLSEQQMIADFLARETAKIDSLIEKEKQIIEKMKEYRTALISAAVTGKIDVRGEENA